MATILSGSKGDMGMCWEVGFRTKLRKFLIVEAARRHHTTILALGEELYGPDKARRIYKPLASGPNLKVLKQLATDLGYSLGQLISGIEDV